MNTPRVQNSLSIGNMLTIGVLILALVGGWYQFETRLSLIEQQMDLNVRTIGVLQSERDDTRDRLTRLEVQLGNIDKTLGAVAKAVGAK